MMEYTVEKISGNKVKITFTVPAEDFEAEVQNAYLKNRGQIMLTGWRKGKAPRKIIERIYGSKVFYEDALDAMFPNAYIKAVEENDLKVVGRPSVDVVTMEKDQPVVFTAETYVRPEVELGAYKDVEIERKKHTVTDEEVEEKLAHERHENARVVEVTDRALQDGDKAELDYSGSVDGVKFDGGTAEHQSLVIGSNTFIPGFEEQMIGMNIGEERDLAVKFPEEYHAEGLKGKDAVFHVKLHAITREEEPALDDEFAADVSDFDTLEEYRADIRTKLQAQADERSEADARNALLDKIVADAKIDIPQPMIEEKLDEMMDEMSWRMKQQGFSIEQYLKILGQTPAQMRDMYRSEAERRVRTELTIDSIVKAEALQADEADVDKEIGEYAASVNKTVDEMKAQFGEEQLNYFRNIICTRKAYDLLWDSAKVTEVVEKAEDVSEQAE